MRSRRKRIIADLNARPVVQRARAAAKTGRGRDSFAHETAGVFDCGGQFVPAREERRDGGGISAAGTVGMPGIDAGSAEFPPGSGVNRTSTVSPARWPPFTSTEAARVTRSCWPPPACRRREATVIPARMDASSRFGVISAARGRSNSIRAPHPSASSSARPCELTITGSTTSAPTYLRRPRP